MRHRVSRAANFAQQPFEPPSLTSQALKIAARLPQTRHLPRSLRIQRSSGLPCSCIDNSNQLITQSSTLSRTLAEATRRDMKPLLEQIKLTLRSCAINPPLPSSPC